jgi:hypothetical protein
MQPLAGVRILDFSTPFPWPLAKLFRAGAEMMPALPIEKASRDRTRTKSSPSLGVDNHLIAVRI